MVPAITPSFTSRECISSDGASKSSLKLYRMVRIMMIAVLVHFCPFVVTVIVTAIPGTKIPQVISFAAYWWLVSNSFVNTIIYYAKNAKFRDRMLELAGRVVPRCCQDLGEELYSIWRSPKRNRRPSSAYKDPGRTSVEFASVRTDQGNSVE